MTNYVMLELLLTRFEDRRLFAAPGALRFLVLDGLYAHLYGLTRDELAYILDTFPIVRRKDEEKYGEAWGESAEPYRTKRMVLDAYGRLESLTH